MKKKIIVFLIAVVLICIVAVIGIGKPLLDKYSYSDERVDLDEYFGSSGEKRAMILQNARVEETALVRDGVCYFDLDTVHKYMNEVFYVDWSENRLLYTDANETKSVKIGEDMASYVTASGVQLAEAPVCFAEGDVLYLAAEYVRQFSNYSYTVYERQVQIYNQWDAYQAADILKDTEIRLKGGIKSPILREIQVGETVEVLEQMETWSKVKTADGFIGYVENKKIGSERTVTDTPVTDYVAPEYTGLPMSGKVNLGFHSIGAKIGNSTFYEAVSDSKGLNVIAPTWFSLCDEEGNYNSFGETSYVDNAHKIGLQVWGVLDNFNYRNETKTQVNEYKVLSNTTKRQKLISGIVDEAVTLGLDGINIDFEQVAQETGVHYVQFLRELSVACRKNHLVLSVDDYVPFHFNEHYRLDVQGQIADYVIIMGYDEHWHGSKDPGSVASLDYVRNGIEKTVSEVPREKVINALPLYTIVWTTNGADVSDEYLTLNNLAGFLKQMTTKPVWDETTGQNYLEWQSSAGLKQVWLEDADSIKVKLGVMMANEIGGVAVWRLGYGTPAVWESIYAYSIS